MNKITYSSAWNDYEKYVTFMPSIDSLKNMIPVRFYKVDAKDAVIIEKSPKDIKVITHTSDVQIEEKITSMLDEVNALETGKYLFSLGEKMPVYNFNTDKILQVAMFYFLSFPKTADNILFVGTNGKFGKCYKTNVVARAALILEYINSLLIDVKGVDEFGLKLATYLIAKRANIEHLDRIDITNLLKSKTIDPKTDPNSLEFTVDKFQERLSNEFLTIEKSFNEDK